MSGHRQSSYFLEDKSKPLNPKNASLNDSLQTQYIDLDDRDDSFFANATRTVSKSVGTCCSPRQVLGLLRVLKAITLAFIVLTILADLTYIIFVEFLSSNEVKIVAGGTRDTILRIYGLGLSLLGLAIELDYSKVIKKFSGLKGFIPRAFLYFFIAQITGSHPMMRTGGSNSSSSSSSSSSSQAYANNDDASAAEADDAYVVVEDTSSTSNDELKIPTSAVGFQRATSLVL